MNAAVRFMHFLPLQQKKKFLTSYMLIYRNVSTVIRKQKVISALHGRGGGGGGNLVVTLEYRDLTNHYF